MARTVSSLRLLQWFEARVAVSGSKLDLASSQKKFSVLLIGMYDRMHYSFDDSIFLKLSELKSCRE